jgi:hypothetical protein
MGPKAPNVLSRRLARVNSSVKKLGIIIERKHDGRARSVRIEKVSLEPLVSLVDENHARIASDSTNDVSNDFVSSNDKGENIVSQNDENHAQNTATNDINDTNDICTTSTENPDTHTQTEDEVAKLREHLKNLKEAGEWSVHKRNDFL